MLELKNKRVLVTGGQSMVGACVVSSLRQRGAIVDDCPHCHFELLDRDSAWKYIVRFSPDHIVHCAGYNGNVAFNAREPGEVFWQTTVMATNIFSFAYTLQYKHNGSNLKILSVLPSCSYPDLGPDAVLHEKDLLSGPPHPSVACHGLAKRNLFSLSQMLNKQYGLKAVCVVLNNCYGPRDRTELDRTKVVMSLIKKFVDAVRKDEKYVECWGTGNARREILFSEDAGEGIVRVLESYEDVNLPLNVGTGQDYSIKELATTIAEQVGFMGEVVWNTEKPEGQLKKLLDVTRMKEILKWGPSTSLVDGLQKTIEYYKSLPEEVRL